MTRRINRLLLAATAAAALFLTVAFTVGQTFGAFTKTAGNSGNSFSAASDFFRFASGTYTGNGVGARAITGVGFKPALVLIKGNSTAVGVGRTSTMTGDATKPLSGATALATSRIQSLDSDGFTIGTNAQVNANGTSYQWAAFATGQELKIRSYTGNGAATQAITGLGFQPESVLILPASAQAAVMRSAGMTTTFPLGTGTGTANQINSLDANGFTVGNSAAVNTNGIAYHYIAFDSGAGVTKVSTYTGNAADNRNVTGIGFQPRFLLVRANDTATSRRAIWRTSSLTGDASLSFTGTANTANLIQGLQSDGFQLGTDGNVNANAISYHLVAVG
jgi:predicted membrane protein